MHREGLTNVLCDLYINYSPLTNPFQCTHKLSIMNTLCAFIINETVLTPYCIGISIFKGDSKHLGKQGLNDRLTLPPTHAHRSKRCKWMCPHMQAVSWGPTCCCVSSGRRVCSPPCGWPTPAAEAVWVGSAKGSSGASSHWTA